jgi:hypothetical protein
MSARDQLIIRPKWWRAAGEAASLQSAVVFESWNQILWEFIAAAGEAAR